MSLAIELATSPVICMYCRRQYGEIVSPPDLPGLPSHGVCPECIPLMWQRMGVMRKETA